MKLLDITCEVTDKGTLPLMYGERARDVLKGMKGKLVHLVIEEPKRYSSNKQLQYYMATIVIAFQQYYAAQGQWIETDELHDMMMKEIGNFKIQRLNPFTDKMEDDGRMSYKSLSTTEAEEYHTKCRLYAAKELLIDIPEPKQKG